jgi:hypothetical protein
MAGMTSSRTGTLYFAYGSNLSAHQMHHRCTDSPLTSGVPVAIARLDDWKWVICERGYANVVPLPEASDASVSAQTRAGDVSDEDESVVWGVLYNMTPGDERVLDEYEGHDEGRNPAPERNPDPGTVGRTPELQGDWVCILPPFFFLFFFGGAGLGSILVDGWGRFCCWAY